MSKINKWFSNKNIVCIDDNNYLICGGDYSIECGDICGICIGYGIGDGYGYLSGLMIGGCTYDAGSGTGHSNGSSFC